MNTTELQKANRAQEQMIELQKQDSLKVRAMMQTEGFKIVANSLDKHSKDLTNKLIEAKDIIEVQHLQAEIKALRTFVDNLAFWSTIQG